MLKLPWAVRHRINTQRARWLLGSVLRLPPLEVATHQPKAEVHMMLGRHDLVRALAALRTFFHYSQLADRVGVVFHQDGTLSDRAQRKLTTHIRGARFTRYPSDDPKLTDLWRDRPYCKDYYGRQVGCIQKLFHPAAFASTDRIIAIDTDVAFFARPDAIVRWVDQADSPPQFVLEKQGPHDDPGPDVREHFQRMRASLPDTSDPIQIKHYYFNAGLMTLPRNRLDFDLIEQFLHWRTTQAKGLHGFWFTDWNVDQTAYMVNYAAWPDAKPFDDDYRCGDYPARVCSHFLSPHYYKKKCLHRIRQALRDAARG